MKKSERISWVIVVIAVAILSFVSGKQTAHAMVPCGQGSSISEQSSVGCQGIKDKRYFGLYGFRNLKTIKHTSSLKFRPHSQRKLKWGVSIPAKHE